MLVAGVGLALAACDDDTSSDDAASRDAAMASALCASLRDQTNALVRIANDAVSGIETRTPEDRAQAILGGFDAALISAESFARAVPELDLPEIAEEPDLRAEVESGAAVAVEELQEERALFAEEAPVVADDDVRGRVGQFFNSMEKVMSVVEPAIADYDRRELQRAFLDEPTCRHVIQQFRIDDTG